MLVRSHVRLQCSLCVGNRRCGCWLLLGARDECRHCKLVVALVASAAQGQTAGPTRGLTAPGAPRELRQTQLCPNPGCDTQRRVKSTDRSVPRVVQVSPDGIHEQLTFPDLATAERAYRICRMAGEHAMQGPLSAGDEASGSLPGILYTLQQADSSGDSRGDDGRNHETGEGCDPLSAGAVSPSLEPKVQCTQ